MNRRVRLHQWVVWTGVLGVALIRASGWATSVQGPVIQHSPQGLRITVHLGFASQAHEFPPAAWRVLDLVGRMLKDHVLYHRVITIVGHANDSEDGEVNRELSAHRALAVQRYFVEHHGIAATRLPVVARGEAAPLDRENPQAALNRRIEFRSQ